MFILGVKKYQVLCNGMFNKRVMEINPSHPVMKKLSQSLDDDTQKEAIAQLVDVLYDSAMLSSGYQLEDINGYLKKVYAYMN